MAEIKRPELGARPEAKGVTFRVWAPHAEKVYVTGTFNAWDLTATPLAGEANGYWSA
jgi:1,4-alpha-glucan branching enzyme